MSSRPLPVNLEAERAVLGAVLIEGPPSFPRVVERLKATDFYPESHRAVYSAMLSLFERNAPIDLLTIQDELTVQGNLVVAGGPAGLAMLLEQGAVSAYLDNYITMVRDVSFKRQLIQASSVFLSQAFDETKTAGEVAEAAETKLLDLLQQRVESGARRVSEALPQALNTAEGNYERKSHITGLPTGIESLDERTSGFQKKNLILVAGRPGAGKSAIVLTMLMAAAEAGAKALFMSMEMSEQEIITRLLCSEARVDYMAMRSGYMTFRDWGALSNAAGRLSELDIWIDEGANLSVNEVRARARRMKQTRGLDLLAVDYLQLMKGTRLPGSNREQEIASISRGLKAIAKELNIPVIALSQLSRAVENRAARDFRPQVSDLRESGAQEADADLILLLYRPSLYKDDIPVERQNIAEIIIGKQRNGPLGVCEAIFLPEYARFENPSTRSFSGPTAIPAMDPERRNGPRE